MESKSVADLEKAPLVEDQVTLNEAIENKAMRNVLFDNLVLAEALSHTAREKIGTHVIGMLLAICAGQVNAIAFCKFNTYVSHVSGVSTAVGLTIMGQQPGDVMMPIEIIAYFIAGAVLAGLIIPKATLKMGQARYELVLFLVAAMEFSSWCSEMRHFQVLAAAMGLQNAMITSWSGAVLRTTHHTGTATDLGSSLGRIVSRFLRHGCRCGNYTEQDWDEHTVDRQKFVLMCCLLSSFILGGYVGSWAYSAAKLHALLLPAGLTSLLGAMHMGYSMSRWDEVKAEKAAEVTFQRQLSGGNESKGDKPPADRMEMFMRQISGRSTQPQARAVGA